MNNYSLKHNTIKKYFYDYYVSKTPWSWYQVSFLSSHFQNHREPCLSRFPQLSSHVKTERSENIHKYYAQVFLWWMLLVVVVIVDVSHQLVVGLLVGQVLRLALPQGAESGWRLGFAQHLHWLPEGAADWALPSASASKRRQVTDTKNR